MSRIFVGNLPFNATEQEIETFFQPAKLADVNVIFDKVSGRSKGFAFVELENPSELQKIVDEKNGQLLGGRALTVGAAKERPQKTAKPGRDYRVE